MALFCTCQSQLGLGTPISQTSNRLNLTPPLCHDGVTSNSLYYYLSLFKIYLGCFIIVLCMALSQIRQGTFYFKLAPSSRFCCQKPLICWFFFLMYNSSYLANYCNNENIGMLFLLSYSQTILFDLEVEKFHYESIALHNHRLIRSIYQLVPKGTIAAEL